MLLQHLLSTNHQLKYLEGHFPTFWRSLRNINIDLEKDKDYLKQVAQQIEKSIGRQNAAVINEKDLDIEVAASTIIRERSKYFDSIKEIPLQNEEVRIKEEKSDDSANDGVDSFTNPGSKRKAAISLEFSEKKAKTIERSNSIKEEGGNESAKSAVHSKVAGCENYNKIETLNVWHNIWRESKVLLITNHHGQVQLDTSSVGRNMPNVMEVVVDNIKLITAISAAEKFIEEFFDFILIFPFENEFVDVVKSAAVGSPSQQATPKKLSQVESHLFMHLMQRYTKKLKEKHPLTEVIWVGPPIFDFVNYSFKKRGYMNDEDRSKVSEVFVRLRGYMREFYDEINKFEKFCFEQNNLINFYNVSYELLKKSEIAMMTVCTYPIQLPHYLLIDDSKPILAYRKLFWSNFFTYSFKIWRKKQEHDLLRLKFDWMDYENCLEKINAINIDPITRKWLKKNVLLVGEPDVNFTLMCVRNELIPNVKCVDRKLGWGNLKTFQTWVSAVDIQLTRGTDILIMANLFTFFIKEEVYYDKSGLEKLCSFPETLDSAHNLTLIKMIEVATNKWSSLYPSLQIIWLIPHPLNFDEIYKRAPSEFSILQQKFIKCQTIMHFTRIELFTKLWMKKIPKIAMIRLLHLTLDNTFKRNSFVDGLANFMWSDMHTYDGCKILPSFSAVIWKEIRIITALMSDDAEYVERKNKTILETYTKLEPSKKDLKLEEYKSKWVEFWNDRSKYVQSSTIPINKFDYTLEWHHCWAEKSWKRYEETDMVVVDVNSSESSKQQQSSFHPLHPVKLGSAGLPLAVFQTNEQNSSFVKFVSPYLVSQPSNSGHMGNAAQNPYIGMPVQTQIPPGWSAPPPMKPPPPSGWSAQPPTNPPPPNPPPPSGWSAQPPTNPPPPSSWSAQPPTYPPPTKPPPPSGWSAQPPTKPPPSSRWSAQPPTMLPPPILANISQLGMIPQVLQGSQPNNDQNKVNQSSFLANVSGFQGQSAQSIPKSGILDTVTQQFSVVEICMRIVPIMIPDYVLLAIQFGNVKQLEICKLRFNFEMALINFANEESARKMVEFYRLFPLITVTLSKKTSIENPMHPLQMLSPFQDYFLEYVNYYKEWNKIGVESMRKNARKDFEHSWNVHLCKANIKTVNTKISDHLRSMENKVVEQSFSGNSLLKNMSKNSKFDPTIRTLTILAQLTDHIGIFGPLVEQLLENALELEKDEKEAISLFEDEESVSLIEFIQEKLNKLVNDESVDQVDSLLMKTGMESCEKLFTCIKEFHSVKNIRSPVVNNVESSMDVGTLSKQNTLELEGNHFENRVDANTSIPSKHIPLSMSIGDDSKVSNFVLPFHLRDTRSVMNEFNRSMPSPESKSTNNSLQNKGDTNFGHVQHKPSNSNTPLYKSRFEADKSSSKSNNSQDYKNSNKSTNRFDDSQKYKNSNKSSNRFEDSQRYKNSNKGNDRDRRHDLERKSGNNSPEYKSNKTNLEHSREYKSSDKMETSDSRHRDDSGGSIKSFRRFDVVEMIQELVQIAYVTRNFEGDEKMLKQKITRVLNDMETIVTEGDMELILPIIKGKHKEFKTRDSTNDNASTVTKEKKECASHLYNQEESGQTRKRYDDVKDFEGKTYTNNEQRNMGQNDPNNQQRNMGQNDPNNQQINMGQNYPNNQQRNMGHIYPNDEQRNMGQNDPNNQQRNMGQNYPNNEQRNMGQNYPNNEHKNLGQNYPNNQQKKIGKNYPNNEQRNVRQNHPSNDELRNMGQNYPNNEQRNVGQDYPNNEERFVPKKPYEASNHGNYSNFMKKTEKSSPKFSQAPIPRENKPVASSSVSEYFKRLQSSVENLQKNVKDDKCNSGGSPGSSQYYY